MTWPANFLTDNGSLSRGPISPRHRVTTYSVCSSYIRHTKYHGFPSWTRAQLAHVLKDSGLWTGFVDWTMDWSILIATLKVVWMIGLLSGIVYLLRDSFVSVLTVLGTEPKSQVAHLHYVNIHTTSALANWFGVGIVVAELRIGPKTLFRTRSKYPESSFWSYGNGHSVVMLQVLPLNSPQKRQAIERSQVKTRIRQQDRTPSEKYATALLQANSNRAHAS